MKKVRNGFIKNLRYICLISVIVFGLMTIVGTGGGGGGGGGDNNGTPEDQLAEITFTYSGTAKCSPFVTHPVRLDFYEVSTGNIIAAQDFDANPDMLKDGYTFTTYRFSPGTYEVYTRWDWNDDVGKDSFEPIGQPNPATFTIDGYNTAKLNIQLVDVTSPSDLGKVEGVITYNGSNTGWHDLHIVLQDDNYNTIAEQVVPYWLVSDSHLSSGYYYNFTDVPAGIYCCDKVVAYWDVNDNGIYDNDPIGRYLEALYVSPGLPTVKIDIQLQ